MKSDRLLLVAQPQLNKFYLPYSMFQHKYLFYIVPRRNNQKAITFYTRYFLKATVLVTAKSNIPDSNFQLHFMLKLAIPLLHVSDPIVAEKFYCNKLGFHKNLYLLPVWRVWTLLLWT